MKRSNRVLTFAALICGLVIVAGSIRVTAQKKTNIGSTDVIVTKTLPLSILRLNGDCLFLNPTSREQMLGPEEKKLRKVEAGELSNLSARDAVEQKDGEYVFKIGFIVSAENVGSSAYSADWVYKLPEFANRFRVGKKIIGEQSLKFIEKESASYAAGNDRKQPVIATIRLAPGKNIVSLSLDDDHLVPEPKDYKPVKGFIIDVKP